MKLSPDSPELTAFALGQLDAARTAEIAEFLRHSPEFRAEVDAIRATAQLLEQEFAAEPAVSLAPDARAEIVSQAAGTERARSNSAATEEGSRPRRPQHSTWLTALLEHRNSWGLGLAAAAAVTLAFVFNSPSARPAHGTESRGSNQSITTPNSETEAEAAAPGKPSVPQSLPSPVLSGVASATTPTKSEGLELSQPSPKVPESSPALAQPARSAAPTKAPPFAPANISTEPLSQVAQGVLDPPAVSRGLPKYGLKGGKTVDSEAKAPRLSGSSDRYSAADALSAATAARGARPSTSAVDSSGYARKSRLGSLAMETENVRSDRSSTLPGSARLQHSDSVESEWRRRYPLPRPPSPDPGPSLAESYEPILENPFKDSTQSPLSTFGIDADTAAYSNVRRFLREGQLPPRDAVRIEEMLNYFPYSYTAPKVGKHPFATHIEVTECPWNTQHRLVRVAIKAREIPRGQRPHANLVFLIDVSGSMAPENKLPLVKRALRLLVERLDGADNVGIVTYAGRAEIALKPTSCDNKEQILSAIEKLDAGSGTNGGEGIEGAYRMARGRFEKAAVNRVILCTDGDFNIGITDRDALNQLIAREAKTGVFLSVLGFGMGNLKDATMEMLADKGNGHYAYIDSFTEARKVLGEQLEGTLVTVAKDVKIQIEFNPLQVASWRQIGYENRALAARDFNDDTKDAGEVGAGHSVTALYEIIHTGAQLAANGGPFRYQPKPASEPPGGSPEHAGELLYFKLRYKQPDSEASILMEESVTDGNVAFAKATTDCKWSAAVASFGMLLRNSPHKGNATYESVLRLAEQGLGRDEQGYRSEFIDLVRQAASLRQR